MRRIYNKIINKVVKLNKEYIIFFMNERLMRNIKKFKLSPIAIIALSFAFTILLGSIFLFFPFTHNQGVSISYFDALFTSTSATCVTGLVSLKDGVAATFNLAGRIIIAILIQIGGIGVVTFAVILFVITNRKLTYTNQSLIKESRNLDSYKGIKRVLLEVFAITIFFEFIGAILIFLILFYKYNYPMDASFGYAFFHSISSFNNAGFDLFGTTSLMIFKDDIWLNLITALLIIFGGLGYLVIIDGLSKKFNFKRFRLHTKIVLTFTLVLILVGTLLIYLCEINNSTEVSFFGAFFMSVSTRTAGFSLYDLSKFRDITLIIMIVFMFIGASPGGTGGGVKTSTILIFITYVCSLVTDKKPHAFRRSFSGPIIRRALLIILLGLLFFIFGLALITVFESNYNYILDGVKYNNYVDGSSTFNLMDYTFEAMSAYGTVGLSTGFTPYYSVGSKIVLCTLMYVGRLGPITISTAFKSKNTQAFRYAEEDVSIG